MQTIPFCAVGAHDIQLVEQGHPPGWRSPAGGGLRPGGRRRRPGRAGRVAHRGRGGPPRGARRAAPDRRHLRQLRLHAEQGPDRLRRAAHLGPTFGYRLPGPPEVDFAAVMERMRAMRVNSSKFDAVPVVAAAGVDVYLGDARFAAKDAVEVDGRKLRFRAAVIATGSRARVPEAEGLANVGFWDHIASLRRLDSE